jgi:hypothetical protein
VTLEEPIANLTDQRSTLESQLGRIAVELGEVQAQTERQTEEVEARSVTVSHYAQQVQQSVEFVRTAESELQRPAMSQLTTLITFPTGPVTGIAFGPQCQSVMAIGQNRRFCQFGLPALAGVSNFLTVYVENWFRIHPDRQRIASDGSDNFARVISLHTGRVLSELGSHSETCTDCL